MKLTYDELADAAYFRLSDQAIARSQRITFNVSLDLDADGEVIGVEVLNVKKRGLSPDGLTVEAAVSAARPDSDAIQAERARRRAARQREGAAQ
jgi:uncharacterized protein YuzE